MKPIIVCVIMLLQAIPVWSRIINVPVDYATIQAGIDASVSGDTVLVAQGEYNEEFIIDNKNILFTSSIGPDSTIIRGNLRIQGQTDTTCVIRGFTFRGIGNFSPLIGLTANNSPKIEGNILMSNWSSNCGGAILYTYGHPIIRSNVIKYNRADWSGGGIGTPGFWDPRADGLEISYNIIFGNESYLFEGGCYGGAILISGNAIIKSNLIYDNTASNALHYSYGGGIYFHQDSQRMPGKSYIINNTIINNSTSREDPSISGAGLYLKTTSGLDTIIVKNNIFAFNSHGSNIRAIIAESSFCDWDYNLIYGDTTSVYSHGEHDINEDPLFWDLPGDDYRLGPNSPCIDAGDPSFPLDPDSTRCDIGAYFFDQGVGINDGTPSGPYNFTLKQNYPNPFNAETVISYSLQNYAAVSLRIMAITGQLVKTMSDSEHQSAGEHRVVWDGTDRHGMAVSTGIYFYELYVDSYRESKAMIMVR
jgi:hypothetical protein